MLWATIGPVARFSLARGVDPLELSFWRALLGGALFGVHALVIGRVRVAPRDLPAIAGFALVGVTLFFGAYLEAVRLGGAALAAVLLYTAPVWVVLASAVLLREPITARKALAVALTLSGVALVALASDPSVRLSGGAIVWGLIAGLAYAGYYLFGKRWFERYPAPTVFLYALPLGALALAPLVRWSDKAPVDWLVILWLAAPPTYLAYLVYSIGLRRVEAGGAATVATLEPVVAALLAYAIWGEALGAWGYAGAALVLAGVLLTSTRRRG